MRCHWYNKKKKTTSFIELWVPAFELWDSWQTDQVYFAKGAMHNLGGTVENRLKEVRTSLTRTAPALVLAFFLFLYSVHNLFSVIFLLLFFLVFFCSCSCSWCLPKVRSRGTGSGGGGSMDLVQKRTEEVRPENLPKFFHICEILFLLIFTPGIDFIYFFILLTYFQQMFCMVQILFKVIF